MNNIEELTVRRKGIRVKIKKHLNSEIVNTLLRSRSSRNSRKLNFREHSTRNWGLHRKIMAKKRRFGSSERGFDWRNQVSRHGRPRSKGIAESCWSFGADIDRRRERGGERHGRSANAVDWELEDGGWVTKRFWRRRRRRSRLRLTVWMAHSPKSLTQQGF